jgi:predicted DNA-binding WGR domain protein
MASKRFEFRDGKSSKFWEVGVGGSAVTVRFGRIGTEGQTTVKEFRTAAEAKAHAEKVTAEKVRKGYAPASPGARSGAKKAATPKKKAGRPAKKAGTPKTKAASPTKQAGTPKKQAGPAFTVTHQVEQRMNLDLSRINEDDAESAMELHREPDIYVSDESFPGKMAWRIGSSTERRVPGRKDAMVLERTILFTFTWSDARAMSAWARRNVAPDDALLPSHVAGDFEGIFVGDEMMDYQTTYRGTNA